MPADDTVPVGIYWDPDVWDQARAAHVADLRYDPQAPAAFIQWLHRSLEEYAQRGPQGRATVSVSPPQRRGPGQRQGRSRMSPLRTSALALVDEAVSLDLEQLGKLSSRSGFVYEAVATAVETARKRCPDGVLPPAPPRLNTNPHRRRPLRRFPSGADV